MDEKKLPPAARDSIDFDALVDEYAKRLGVSALASASADKPPQSHQGSLPGMALAARAKRILRALRVLRWRHLRGQGD